MHFVLHELCHTNFFFYLFYICCIIYCAVSSMVGAGILSFVPSRNRIDSNSRNAFFQENIKMRQGTENKRCPVFLKGNDEKPKH